MGGQAHGDPDVKRLSTPKWAKLLSHMKSLLTEHDCVRRVEAPRADPEKLSHGDLDLITLIDAKDRHSLNEICSKIRLTNKVDHSYLYNYLDEKHQVDVQVLTDPETFDLAYFCQSYGDLGMILSKCARAIGITLSSNEGLCLREKMPISGDYKTYRVTKKPHEICTYLGLDFEEWQRGFANREAIFEWIKPISPAFQMRSTKEKRYSQREMFQRFLQLARTECIDHLSSTSTIRALVLDRLRLDGNLDRVQQMIDIDRAKEIRQSELKKVFNANIINDYLTEHFATELKGRQLGIFLTAIRGALPSDRNPTAKEVKRITIEQYKAMYSK